MAKISIDKVTHKLTAVIYSKPRKTGRTEITADNADITSINRLMTLPFDHKFSMQRMQITHDIIAVISGAKFAYPNGVGAKNGKVILIRTPMSSENMHTAPYGRVSNTIAITEKISIDILFFIKHFLRIQLPNNLYRLFQKIFSDVSPYPLTTYLQPLYSNSAT